jgi:hypothetical protein
MTQSLEIATFNLIADAQDFVGANAEVTAWLTQQPGFRSRLLAQKDDGGHLDLIVWESPEAATAAAAKMGEIMDLRAMSLMDPATVSMSHATVLVSVG